LLEISPLVDRTIRLTSFYFIQQKEKAFAFILMFSCGKKFRAELLLVRKIFDFSKKKSYF